MPTLHVKPFGHQIDGARSGLHNVPWIGLENEGEVESEDDEDEIESEDDGDGLEAEDDYVEDTDKARESERFDIRSERKPWWKSMSKVDGPQERGVL
ncbi:hypothetical protein NLG97_g493 [Lecanicillium saksenae]|uniref:Uncharacterized protein n=1 Tax=Lecanicillium saksenae TaxID=468837 RepID=A0ACC1R8C0_9HYPO|nr:hypothetical protein NLG97_g493 [Lecanicillium saksenae]